MSTLAVNLDIRSTKALVSRFSSDRAVMLRGRHGIGKSQVVYQIAGSLRHDLYKDRDYCVRMSAALAKDSGFRKMVRAFWKRNEGNPTYEGHARDVWHYDMGVPVIERRLSQMTEGDITGIPFEGNRGGTVFRAVEWLLAACEYPSVLFLDELNRAIKGVEQATFQLADSKAFDGNLLHEGTRVFVAVNVGEQYDVQPMDPAAISRYATIDLEPTLKDWLDWASDNCNQGLVEFIRSNEKFLEYKDTFEANKKYPDRRAWGNLDAELTQAGLYDEVENTLFCHMAASMVGFEPALAYWNFMKERDADISAEDVLSDWSAVLKRLPKDDTKKYSKFIDLMGKLDHKLKTHNLNDSEARNMGEFMKSAPPEVFMTCWKSINVIQANMIKVHKTIQDYTLKLLANNQGITPAQIPAPAPAAAAPAVTAATPAPAAAPAAKPKKRK